jgi:arsenate reductase
MITLYGIKNCDTVKKARQWLDARKIEYNFHDYKIKGLTREQLLTWGKELGWQILLNTKGTTWRQLPDEQKQNIDEQKALELMLQNTSLIKRPLINLNNHYMVGFSEAQYSQWFE